MHGADSTGGAAPEDRVSSEQLRGLTSLSVVTLFPKTVLCQAESEDSAEENSRDAGGKRP